MPDRVSPTERVRGHIDSPPQQRKVPLVSPTGSPRHLHTFFIGPPHVLVGLRRSKGRGRPPSGGGRHEAMWSDRGAHRPAGMSGGAVTAPAALAGSGATGSGSSRLGSGDATGFCIPLTGVLLNARCRTVWCRNRPPQEHLRQIQQKGREP
jgi:hypothetical protein